MLLRGTEGESVADARRIPQMDGFVHGVHRLLAPIQAGSLVALPELPTSTNAQSTAHYTSEVLNGTQPVPAPIAQQVAHILQLLKQIER